MSDERTTDRPAEPQPAIPPVPLRPFVFEVARGPDWVRRLAWSFVVVAAACAFVVMAFERPFYADPEMCGMRVGTAAALALAVPVLVILYFAYRRRGGEVPDDPRPQSERDED